MTISEETTRNFEKATVNTMTAKEMALQPHNLTHDAKYSRMENGSLWIWSNWDNCWKQIEKSR